MTALVGIDGGASGVRAQLVEQLPSGRLVLGARGVALDWAQPGGFEPLPLELQLAERSAPGLSPAEVKEGAAWVQRVASSVVELLRGLEEKGLGAGVCLPGLKTADGAGVCALRRGPRMPTFARDLERQFARHGLQLERPIDRIHDDGDAAAWGEEWAEGGALSGTQSAYVVALGTGVAEGLKVDGAIPRASSLRALLPAPWSTGDEDRLGMHGLHARLAGQGTIGARARGREPEAQALLASWAEDLAGFLAGRVEALAGMGIQVDRVVVGARGGELLCDGALEEFARLPLEKSLARRLDRPMSQGFLVPSSLRAAPAIGVAAASLGLVKPA